MSHYPNFNRRPRIHPHSKNYELPFQNPVDDTSRFQLPGSSSSSLSSPTTTEIDRTRSPKMLAVFVSIILLCGGLNHSLSSSPISVSRITSKVVEDSNNTVSSSSSTSSKSSTSSTSSSTTPNFKNIIQGHNGQHFLNGKFMEVAGNLTNFADIQTPMTHTDVPFFWHIPRSGGSTIKQITAECLGLTQASEVGSVGGHIESEELMAVHHVEGGKFMNVDTTTLEGLDRAIDLNLASFPNLHVIVSPFLMKAAELFDPQEHRGRVFLMLRNPIERAVSMYYYLASIDENGSILNGMTLEQYATSDLVENNWITRFLSNQMGGELTEEHEALAREFLRRKCLIGLLSYKAASLQRFERYFGWRIVGQKMEHCQDQLLNWNWASKNKHPRIQPDGVVWRSLEDHNEYDMRLYAYAVELFHEQAALFN